MFHNQDQNRKHYDLVSGDKQALYFQRFDTQILDSNPIVARLLTKAFDEMFPSPSGEPSGGQLLDVGCGTGFYYPLLSQHAQAVIGVDVSRAMLDEADRLIERQQLKNCRVQECSALDLPFEDAVFDTVHCWDVLHHVSDVSKTLSEIDRVLKPGGRFIAVEPNLLNPSITWYHARRRSEWRLFTQNQFSLVRPLRKKNFDVKVRYDNTIISFLNERTEWIWKAANTFTSVWPLHMMSFRYVMDAIKPSVDARDDQAA